MVSVELLRQIDLFRGLSETGLQALALASHRIKIKKNQVLFTEGDKGDSIFVLEKGAVQLHKSTPTGREVLIRTIQPGEIFAEIVLFEQDAYPVTATVAQSGTVCAIPKLKVHALLESRDFRGAFIGGLLKRYRYLTSRILYLSAHDSEERFRLYLKEQHGEKAGAFLALPKKTAAAVIGVTPETLSRLLLKYKKEITWAKGEIKITEKFWKNNRLLKD